VPIGFAPHGGRRRSAWDRRRDFAAVVTAVRPLPDVQLAVVESVVFLILAVIVGTLGAVGPARHGARIDVLEARHQN
jgi:hypothetical protein